MLVNLDTGKLRKTVSVASKKCLTCACFVLFADKGTFAQGRGYTSYHEKPRWVCGTRHLHGCPIVAICLDCRLAQAPYEAPHTKCRCGSTNIVMADEGARTDLPAAR